MKKIKNICKECNSIVNVELVRIPKEWYKPIKKEIKLNKMIIKNLKETTDKLISKVMNWFGGWSASSQYDQIIKILHKHQRILKMSKTFLKYNYHYKCPVCKENIFLKIK